jgi:DNA-binding beta-propeller fold protein YncE
VPSAVVAPEGRFLFVLHRGFIRPDGGVKPAQGELVVYDLASRGRVRAIPLGWNVTDLVFSIDGRYLLCVGEGKRGTKKTPEEFGSVTVVSTRTGKVSAQLPAGRMGLQVALTADASRIFVLSLGDVWKRTKNEPSVLAVFAPDNPRPLATWPLDRASKLALSLDEKWLYVLDGGWPSKKEAEHRNGQVHVFDTATLSSAGVHDVGTRPGTLEVNPDDSLSVLSETSTQTDDVTVVRVSNGEVLDKIPVGGGCRGVDLAPGGQFVYTYAPGEVSFIDTHTHKKTVAYKAPTGKVHAVFTLDADAAFVALTDQQLVMWSLETGQPTRTINGFGEPFLLLDPRVR